MRFFLSLLIITFTLSTLSAQEREAPIDINKIAYKGYEKLNQKYISLIGSKILKEQLITLNGDTIKQDMFKGKVTVLNFFGIPCRGCVLEIPYLVKLKKYLKNKNVQIIGLTDISSFDLVTYNASKKIGPNAPQDIMPQLPAFNYPVYNITRDQMIKYFYINGYPYTFIIDKNGIVRFTDVGFPKEKEGKEMKYNKFINEIEKLL